MSLTSTLNGQLGLVCSLCAVLLLGILLHRTLTVLCRMLLTGLIFLPDVHAMDGALKKYAQQGLVGSALRFGIMLVVTCVQLVMVALNIAFTLIYALLPLVAIALLLVLMHERWSDSMLVLVDLVNGQVGDTLHELITAPLTIIDVVGRYVLPIYNFVVYVIIRVPFQLLVWVLKGPGLDHLMQALMAVREAAGAFAMATKSFVVQNNPSYCGGNQSSAVVCSNITDACVSVATQQMATVCLQLAPRELDFMPAFENLRITMGFMNLFVADSCAFIAVFANVTFFPLTDPELWRGADRLLNTFLYAAVAAPSMAITRCQIAGGIEQRPAMCTPDFGPAFDKFASFGIHMGNALTNWMDAAYLFMFKQQNLQTVCDSSSKLSEILWADATVQRLFGANHTVMTRMSSEAFAISDGNSVVFMKNLAGQIRKTYAPNLWPTPVQPQYGIARVLLPGGVNVQDNGLGLLGCRCMNTSRGDANVSCSIITQDGTAWEMPVRWSLAAEEQLLTCARLRIVVQSVRWPHKRVIVNALNQNGESIAKSEEDLSPGDAVVYAIPICGAESGIKALACLPEPIFTRGICFPYCMALRLVHEGFQALTMRGTREWEQGVLMSRRSCVPVANASSSVAPPADLLMQTVCNVMTTTTTTTTITETSSSSGTDSCTYAYSCTTMILNKSTVSAYDQTSQVPPSEGFHLVLMRQPLVVAGDVYMRMFTTPSDGEQRFVDFPTLVGNQVGEFTMEANTPVGIPVTPPADVLKYSVAAERPGEVYEPANYVDSLVPYHPGTLTRTALWYASNPSYNWIKAMAIYCGSEGHDARTQIMLLSSYTPIRIWRVLYHDYENCYVARESGAHVCRPDIALATSLDKEIQIMSSVGLQGSTTLYDTCASGAEFNLWVESMEYYNEENVAVAVRRGTLGDLGRMLVTPDKPQGRTVFYFLNASNISQPAQEGDYLFVRRTWTMGCPAFKVMPDVGAVVGHSFATVAYLFRMPVNLVLNPFAIMELLSSRAKRTCPENSLQHSVLSDCGMKVLSLDEFFAELYTANDALWNVGFWLLSTILPQNAVQESKEASLFRSFLQGAVVVGDATKVVGVFDVVHSVEFMDTGIEDVFLRSRRLLGTKMQMLSKMLGGLKSGFASLLNLGQSVVGLATMSMSAGMNFGMLLASQDPTVQFTGAAVSAPTIAWAQFTYQASVPIVLDALGVVKETGTVSMAPVWAHLQDARSKFENIVQSRSQRACLGLRIMLGYSGSLGKALYYNCLAGQAMVGGMMTLVLTVAVDVQLYRCLCVNPTGVDYEGYVSANCMPMVPPTRQEKWHNTMYAITSRSSQVMQSVCQTYASEIETQVYGAFDPWKQHAVQSAESLASVLDEFFVADAYAGSCQNTLSNPTAMVLTPTPLAHYQVCARTSDCKAKCADANYLFEYEMQRLQNQGSSVHADMQMFDVTLESPFFNRYAAQESNSGWSIVGIRTLPVNSSVYGCQQRCQGRCVAVAQMRADATSIKVAFYCLPPPEMILATVYNTNLDEFEVSIEQLTSDGGDIRGVDFALQEQHTYLVIYVFKAMTADTVQGQTSLLQSHEVHVYSTATNRLVRILRSEDLANGALGRANVVQGLFAGSMIDKPTVSNCRISSITEIASGTSQVLVFYVDFAMDIKTWVLSSKTWIENNYALRAIYRWSETSAELHFYPPCNAACSTVDCGGLCHPGLESVLRLMQSGTLVHIESQNYLFVPVIYDPAANDGMERLRIDASKGLVTLATRRRVRLSNTADNSQILGRWTRGSMFSTVAVTRQVRDVSAHETQNVYPYFFQASTDMSSQWLQEVRVAGVKLKIHYSQQTNRTARALTTCTVLSCSGCATSKLRLLCHQAQNCALSKCLGTIIQTKNALCGIGGLIQQTFLQAVSTWHAMFMMGAELALLVSKGLNEQSLHVIVLKFPTEQFYNLVCACKDMLASVVGMGMSVGTVLSNLLVGKGLDLTGGQDVGALVGEQSLKTLSIGQFFFNCITGVTLLPLMAVHRWIMCMANASLVATSEVGVSVQFGDVMMDTTWMQCAHISSVFDVLNNDNISTEIESVIVMFVKFVLTLVTGIGETLLFGLELCWDSTVDFLVGVVFGVQQMLYAYNLRACKVPNYAMRYVLWCSCQDEAYRIPTAQRSHSIRQGGLWCVGSLSMTLLDGSVGTVYNPYTMQELSNGVQGVTDYINCLSEHSDAGECTAPGSTSLQTLVDQGVEPIAVWARCKNNYMQNTWDIGAGSLFTTTMQNTNGIVDALQSTALAWGNGVGVEFMQCMQDTARMLVDYTSCMRLFLSVSQNTTPSAYFLYEKASGSGLMEPPDACLVFSGLNATAQGALQTLMNDCMMQEGVGQVTACDLNPLIWSGDQPHKTPAANLHGTLFVMTTNNNQSKNNASATNNNNQSALFLSALYEPVLRTFLKAVSVFEGLYDQQSASIDTMLFSADGDFIHDFFDCMYLGPYTRVDVLACDPDNNLDCLFYARDDLGGLSRNFTACFGDAAMHGDHQLPFTCGSQARRSLIKYFFRNYSKTNQHLNINISHKIKEATEALIQNYTDPRSWGCWDPVLGQCHIEACNFTANGYKPCLSTAFEVSSEQVSDFIVKTVLGTLDGYYTLTMHDSAPWTAYYTDTKTQAYPIQWGQDAETATVAQGLGLYAPHTPLVTYGPEQVYTMPTHLEPSVDKRTRESPTWGVCTSLLGQTAMSLPLLFDKAEHAWFPAGFWEGLVGNKLEQVQWVVSNITRHLLMMEHCPFAWHQSKRHAPSESMVCDQTKQQWAMEAKRLKIDAVSIQSQLKNPIQASVAEGLSLPFLGFLQGYLGHADQTCVCAMSDSSLHTKCVLSQETCQSIATAQVECAVLQEACAGSERKYDRSNVGAVLQCLKAARTSIRCPELGPSDWWGLFPVDCSEEECELAPQWVSMGGKDIPYSATRFLNEGKAGMRLPNFKHVNDTYHQSIHYGRLRMDTKDMKQAQCFSSGPDLFPMADNENVADAIIRTLFPAAQALFDSPSTATCSRFVIEVVRAEALGLVSDNAGATARIQAARWKRRCAAKMRQLGMCQMQGVFYDTPPPSNWPQLATCGGITLGTTLLAEGVYLTPGCVMVDPVTRRMYDAHLCVSLLASTIIIGRNAACLMVPQPLDLLQGDIALSMVYSAGGQTLASKEAVTELSDKVTLDFVAQNTHDNKAAREHVSHVLDWWPDEAVPMPPGYHATAAMDPVELAPALFDSHYVYDASTHKAFYVHSAVRNGSFVYNTVGAAGVCRGHKVGMPLFDANTNRICTRSSKKAATPTVPVSTPPTPGGTDELGPIYSDAYIATYFEPEEVCALSHDDVPWTADADDFQSRSAGGVLGWQHYVTMDAYGVTHYDMAQESFPPLWYELSSLRQYDDKWGTCQVPWGAGIPCSTHVDCPSPPAACLPYNEANAKVCFSIEGTKQFKQPCFRTEHCPDGMVCLVDGTCRPLFVHFWNAVEDGMHVMEAAVLADQCEGGTMRGASPWEIVPDALHVHGMCSHHNWFSYRHAIRSGICERPTPEYLSCNASKTEWPWVQERFDRKATSSTTETQTMASGNVLLAHAHPCDVRFMHLQAHTTQQRMQVCTPQPSFLQYDLQEEGSWAGAHMATQTNSDSNGWWLRTYDENTNQVHVGVVGATDSTNVPLGFLGADQNAAGLVGEMSNAPKVHFFRCADKLRCNNPPYTFNGIEVSYRLVGEGHVNLTETSLRRCGSIGYLDATASICTLDIILFPLFAQIMWGEACATLWDHYVVQNNAWLVVWTNDNEAVKMQNSIAANPSMLFCASSACYYAPRSTTLLTEQNTMDSIAALTGKLNLLLQQAGAMVLRQVNVQKLSVTETYEVINQCMAAVLNTLLLSQVGRQMAYGATGPSGLYYAYSLTLYEMPLAWLHHALLVTLLSTIDPSIPAPALHKMGQQNEIAVALWGTDRSTSFCTNAEVLSNKPALWHIICQNKHAAYTFSASDKTWRAGIVQGIENLARAAVQNTMVTNNELVQIYCHDSLSWNCVPGTKTYAACRAQLIAAYNEQNCVSSATELCQNTDWVKRDNLKAYTLQDIMNTLSPTAAQQARQFAQQSQKSLLENMQKIASVVDYATQPATAQAWITAVAITPMDAAAFIQQATGGFNLTQWLEVDVCRSVFNDEDICKTQEADTNPISDPCLFPDVSDRQDLDRYLLTDPECPFYNKTTHKTEAKVIISYLTNAESAQQRANDEIYLCDTDHTEQCIVQFFSNVKELQTTGNNDEVMCEIAQVQAPPGVEVQAFVIKGQDYNTWKTLIEEQYHANTIGAPPKWCSTLGSDWGQQLSPVSNCVWGQTNPGENPDTTTTWASGGSSDWLDLTVDSLHEQWRTQPQWGTEGCPTTTYNGFCAIKIRLKAESRSRGVCGNNIIPPTCASLMQSNDISTFRVCNDDTAGRKGLYRCAPCTKYTPVIKGSGGRFGCFASTDQGRTTQQQMNVESVAKTLGFLSDTTKLLDTLNLTENNMRMSGSADNGENLMMMPLQANVNPTTVHSLRFWAGASTCDADNEPSTCWSGFDSAAVADANQMIWDHATQNPNIKYTMICSEQPFTTKHRTECNDKVDQRRQKLQQFVEEQYRQTNGVWMPRIASGKGVAWQTNVAHSAVGMFSVMYAHAIRDESEQLLAWVLGKSICANEHTEIQNRICVESLTDNTFEPMHPWVGGDFNPFEGVDECVPSTTEASSMCPCACNPQRVCSYYEAHNLSLSKEFPILDSCLKQAFPQTRTMQADDRSNLCQLIKNAVPTSTTCMHAQGLLGGTLHGGEDAISTYDLHDARGIATNGDEVLIQRLLMSKGGLWAGKTLLQEADTVTQKYAFMHMPRRDLHPAHIAFGRDRTVTAAPLVVKALALLAYEGDTSFHGTGTAEWVNTLEQQWREDRAWIATLYPTVGSSAPKNNEKGEWSCPIRAFSFWGGSDASFAPLTPDPLLTQLLFPDVGGGAHPFIKAKSLRDALGKYETTNGACFYERGVGKILIPLTNSEHPCGLQGIVRNLLAGAAVVSKVVNHFATRCNLNLDAPNVNNTQLRSGETLLTAAGGECGVLHRLIPFLMRTRGDAGAIVEMQATTTRSEGGDCHMGRAMQYAWNQRGHLVGRQCALSFKNKTHGISLCPNAGRAYAGTPQEDDRTTMVLTRAIPQSLEQMLLSTMQRRRLYRNRVSSGPPVQFVGPGGVNVPTEVSFGLLYSASIPMALASDLLHVCEHTPGCTAHIPPNEAGTTFFQKYVTRGGLVNSNQESTQAGSAGVDPSQLQATERSVQHAQAQTTDANLWNNDAWTWTFREGVGTKGQRGTVNKTQWLQNRYGACNESYQRYGRLSKDQALVEAITLCEPAPTGGLQTFCQAMAQFRTDITSVNCQIMGQGKDCLYKPGMFYLPYAWSVTNQEFIADTVLGYYTKIVEQPRFSTTSSMSTLCPARNTILGKIRELSLQQQDACPGHQIEYLKTVLKTFKRVGHDLLYLLFCTVMAGANLIGTVFATEPAAAATMAKMALDYVVKALLTAANVIMPILNTIIDVLFGTSSAGQFMKNIISGLCEIFKFVINNIVIGIWCAVVRPWWGGILRGLQKLIRVFDSSSADKMDDFLSKVFGSDSNDVPSCLGSLGIKIPCNMDKEGVDDALFPNQPLATSCWVDTSASYYTAGAGILGGSMTNSFLACSVSDTCAVDPLRFDNYENANDLVPCASCPSVILGEGQKFGCNSYLKRCTCGVRTQAPAGCMQNSDCSQQPNAICSVSSNLDFARDSVTSMVCSQCNVLGAEPVCLMDGAASTGVCTCADVRQSLQSCTSMEDNILVFKSTGYCLTMTTTDQADAIGLSFSELGIARCSLGMGNKCMYVNLPLLAGGQTLKLAVLTGYVGGLFKPQALLFSAVSSGRRLLTEKDEPHRRWCELSQEYGGDRERIRWCTHWKMVGNRTLTAIVTSANGTAHTVEDTFLLSMSQLLQAITANPHLFAVKLLRERPDLVRHILMQHSGLWPTLINSIWQNAEHALVRTPRPSRERKLLLWEQETIVAVSSKYKDADVVTTTLPSCAAIEVPLNKIINAFWNTITYYENVETLANIEAAPSCAATVITANQSNDNSSMANHSYGNRSYDTANNGSSTQNKSSTTTASCGFYQLPPASSRADTKENVGFVGALADLFLTIPTGGIGGRRVLDAAFSTMGYDEAVLNNYVTGRRLLTELSFCNYTRLTFSAPVVQQLLPLLLLLTFFFFIFVMFFSPNTFVTWALWLFVFPSILYWTAYNLSPLCWPMIPPRLPHDVMREIKAVIPDSIDIPTFLIRTEQCDARGRSLVDGSNSANCFKSCAQGPFYFMSWQDNLAWWLCEIDTATCRDIANTLTSQWSVLQDMTSSLLYYADVAEFARQDGDFMRAHRVCAIFTIYHLLFGIMAAAFVILIAPAVFMAVCQVFGAALELIMEASGAEIME